MEKFKEFVNCYLDAWRKYVKFDGRATRKDFWGFVLINLLVSAVIAIVEIIVGMDEGFFSSLYTIATMCPNISLTTRRLHDVNRSGWWQLASIVPLLNFYLIYLVWFKAGTAEANKFGAPAYAEAQPVYGAYSVPVQNDFASYNMCPLPQTDSPVAQPVSPVAAPKCPACGAAVEAGAKFCSECGAPVNN